MTDGLGGKRIETSVSEDVIARAFSQKFGGSLRFDHDLGCWFEWSGSHWKADRTQRAFHYARETSRGLSRGKRNMGRASVALGVERFAAADPVHSVTSDYWDRDPWLLGAPNGTIELRTGRIRAANQVDGITKLTGCKLARGTPRRWLKFLSETTGGDAEIIEFLRRMAGYCLTGVTTEHALFFLYGPGGNGKSVFLNTLAHVLGDYAVNAPMETFTKSNFSAHSTELAMLKGARIVTASETEEGRSWAEARIKTLTGGDPITARFMRRNFFTYTPQFKLLIAGNHQPLLQTPDAALRRRFNLLSFLHRPPQPDPELEVKLRAEAPQILGWAVGGCLAWQQSGLGQPEAVAAATHEYFDEQDTFGQWLSERCELGLNFSEMPTPLFTDWSHYARSLGEEPGSIITLTSRLKRTGLRRAKVGGVRLYKGVRLRYASWEGQDGSALS